MHFSLCNLIADITQNSVEAKAQKIVIRFIESKTDLFVRITDDGEGMSSKKVQQAQNPFYTNGTKHPKRNIGLGIPFLIQTIEDTNGSWHIESNETIGTTVSMHFDLTNIDTSPIGDIPELFRQVFTLPGTYEMIIFRKKIGFAALNYTLIRSEIIKILGSLETVSNLSLLKQFLVTQEELDT